MSVIVRAATPDDASGLAAVMNGVIAEGQLTLFDTPFTEEAERRFVASLGPRSRAHVALIDWRIVGLQTVDLFSALATSVAHVATMGTWVNRDFRGQGVGGRLARESLQFAREQRYIKVVIQVLATNARALAFYERLGFASIGTARSHVRLGSQLLDEVYMEMFL